MINKLDDDKLKYWLGITLCLALLLTVQWRLSQPIQSFTLPVIADISSIKIDEPIQPIPLQVEGYNPKVKLGQQLFFDTSLSGDNQASCSSCYDLQNGGADPAAVSHGFKKVSKKPHAWQSVLPSGESWRCKASTRCFA
ncbi:hypothetical protein C2W62_46965 [Candidatus Entotheonella serta]|nr:hypothetical protein C2W62_46965 [Candidatus Entotheonella serta]